MLMSEMLISKSIKSWPDYDKKAGMIIKTKDGMD